MSDTRTFQDQDTGALVAHDALVALKPKIVEKLLKVILRTGKGGKDTCLRAHVLASLIYSPCFHALVCCAARRGAAADITRPRFVQTSALTNHMQPSHRLFV